MGTYVGNTLVAGATFNPTLLDFKLADHILNDVSWLRADTFSWQPGSVYEAAYNHLADDIYVSSEWRASAPATYIYTKNSIPAIGDTIYSDSACTTSIGSVEGYDSIMNAIIYNNRYFEFRNTIYLIPQTETIAGTTITYYLADDRHKIVLADQESNVSAIYYATGVAWYYILDTTNQRFKLPRTKFGFTGLRDTVGKYVAPGLPDHTHKVQYRRNDNSGYHADGSVSPHIYVDSNLKGSVDTLAASQSNSIYGASTTVQPPATQMYLYFYVGNFTQTALENTAGLNAELFNDKVDKGHQVIAFQAPTAGNNQYWYRKYADGWVEQGRYVTQYNSSTNAITLPVTMATGSYTVMVSGTATTTYANLAATGFQLKTTSGSYCTWTVCGMAAS